MSTPVSRSTSIRQLRAAGSSLAIERILPRASQQRFRQNAERDAFLDNEVDTKSSCWRDGHRFKG